MIEGYFGLHNFTLLLLEPLAVKKFVSKAFPIFSCHGGINKIPNKHSPPDAIWNVIFYL